MNKIKLKIPSSDSKYVQNFGFQQIEVMAGAPMTIKHRYITHELRYSDIKFSIYMY